MALVEQLFRRLDDGRDDARPRDDAAGGANRALTDLGRDRTDLECELRGPRKSVAPLVHRRRARVRRLTAPGDLMALDSERAEDDPERKVQRLEHRPLLDVELQVG